MMKEKNTQNQSLSQSKSISQSKFQSSTLFLKISILLLGLPISFMCLWALPQWTIGFFTLSDNTLVLLGIEAMYLAAIPYFYTLYLAYRLLISIDEDRAFSMSSVATLNRIKLSATSISIIYVCTLPISFILAKGFPEGFIAIEKLSQYLNGLQNSPLSSDNPVSQLTVIAPFAPVINFAFIFIPLVVAVFAAVLHKLLAQMVAIKEENEYTI